MGDDNDSWEMSLIKTLLLDPTASLAKDFVLNPLEFGYRVTNMYEDYVLYEVKRQARYELKLFDGKILDVHPMMFGFIDDDSSRAKKYARCAGMGLCNLSTEKEFRDTFVRVIIEPNKAGGLAVLQRAGTILPWVQASTYKRSDNSLVWAGQLKKAAILDDDSYRGYKTFDMYFQLASTFVDNRQPD
jgi:hypothetical protein